MTSVFSCGIDIEEISRFKKLMMRAEPEFPSIFYDIYTAREIKNNCACDPDYCFILGFSCKEAVFKALGKSWFNSTLNWTDIECLFIDKDNINCCSIVLRNDALKMFNDNRLQTIESSFTISDTRVTFEVLFTR